MNSDDPALTSTIRPEFQGQELHADVLRKFRIVFNAVRTHFQQVERRVGLGGAQIWALSLIRDLPGIGTNSIAQHMDIHQSTASNLIRSLLQKSLINADRSDEDRRQVRLTIRPEGLTLLTQVPGPFEGVLPAALRQLSAPTLTRLDTDLAELIRLLKADESAGGIPLSQI
jgi:DNA-binding MarR family transcriptional regulator